jgi:hypothetical protein
MKWPKIWHLAQTYAFKTYIFLQILQTKVVKVEYLNYGTLTKARDPFNAMNILLFP